MSSGAQPSHPLPPDAEPLCCEVARDGDHARVRVAGALDLATVPLLDSELAALLDSGVRRVILDLSSLEFMDSTGLRFILEREMDARRDGFSLGVVPGPPAVQRVFEVTGTAQRLPFVDG
jgi:anti-anti-sigma factor